MLLHVIIHMTSHKMVLFRVVPLLISMLAFNWISKKLLADIKFIFRSKYTDNELFGQHQ